MSIFKGLFKSRDKPTNSYDSPSYTYFFGRAHSTRFTFCSTINQILK